MPLDDEVRRRFEALADQIRAETARQLGVIAEGLSAAAEAERADAAMRAANDARVAAEKQAAARLAEAVATAEARSRQEGREEGREEGLSQGRQEGRNEGREEGLAQGRREGKDDARSEARASELAANQRLADAIRAIDRARSLSEILDTVAGCAGREAARVAVLIVRGGQLQGWRFIGFDPMPDEAGKFEFPIADAGIIADAVRSSETMSADSGSKTTAPPFADLPPGREMLAVPVPMSGQVVAVLYADQGSHDSDNGSADALRRVTWPAIVEVMTRHATRSLEAVTAFRTAQVVAGRPGAAASTSKVIAGVAGGSDEVSARSHEEEEAARRYARLLVSEIKLYHEAEVIAGRRDRDLVTRLGGEIARARVLYERRVPPHVRGRSDYFHAELVQTLANGDSTLLGQPASKT